MPQEAIFDLITSQGLLWFFAIVMLVPLSILLILFVSLMFAKKYLGLDFGAIQKNQRDEIQSAHDLATEMRLLREQISQQEEALWGTRDHTDRQIKNIQQHFDAKHDDVVDLINKALENQHKIVVFLVRKLGRSEPVRSPKSATEVFLKDRP